MSAQATATRGNPIAGLSGLRLDSSTSIHRAARRMLEQSNLDLRDARSDALTVAFARELEDIIREVFEVDFPELKAQQLFPVRFVSPEALSFTYRMLSKVGAADVINENGSNIPKVDVEGKEWQQPIVTIGASYDFTIFDQMRSGRLGISIDSLKAEAARWAIEYKIEQLAAAGDSTQGLVGIWNAPGVAATAQVSTGTWITQINSIASATTTNATPPGVVVTQAIAADIVAMISQIKTQSLGLYTPDTLVIPTQLAGPLAIPQSPGYNTKSIRSFLEELTGLDIVEWPQLNALDTAGTNGVHGVVLLYKRDPKIVNLMMSMPFTQMPPQQMRMAYEVNCYARTGALQVRYPLAVTFMKGLA